MALERNVEIVASDDEHDGLVAFFAVYNGVPYPIGAVKAGYLESLSGAPVAQQLAEQDKQASDERDRQQQAQQAEQQQTPPEQTPPPAQTPPATA